MKKAKIFAILFWTLLIGGAVGATLWFTLYVDVHHFSRELTQEQRAAVKVGVVQPLKDPIEIVIKNRPGKCIQITEASIDVKVLYVYYKNICQSEQEWASLLWKASSPDGTILESDYAYIISGGMSIGAGEKGEYQRTFYVFDSRVAKLELRTREGLYDR